jgi:hypothetical protein
MTESVPKRWDTGVVFSGQSFIVSGCFPDESALWCYIRPAIQIIILFNLLAPEFDI